uniref:Uncharacterized protein n=1 Tax=Dulem virus 42 TaxID=3145760 RepID=A0AAU8BBN3_9CAUD
MTNALKIKGLPFNQGDLLKKTEDGDYELISEQTIGDSAYVKTIFTLSSDYAEYLKNSGILEEVEEKTDKKFVNIFDEVSKLLSVYEKELSDIDLDMKDQPACLRVEKETVLLNMIKLLKHLNSLKK